MCLKSIVGYLAGFQRFVEVAGIVREAYEEWMVQVLRNLTDVVDGFLLGKTHVIVDRDPVFTADVRNMLRHAAVKPVRLPRRSPNLNAFIEGHRTIAARSASTRTKEARAIHLIDRPQDVSGPWAQLTAWLSVFNGVHGPRRRFVETTQSPLAYFGLR
jgi:hypothetical protein